MYLNELLKPPPVVKYLGTSTIEDGMWYCPGPGVAFEVFLSLVSEPNLYEGIVLSGIEL